MESFGRYQLLTKLATGGMAQVFLAREKPGKDARPDELIVLKRILPHLGENEEFVRMFLQEARVVARLHHPAIAQVRDVGEVEGAYYIVMEYVHGEDVRRLVRQASLVDLTLPIPLAVRIVADAAMGLHFAHEALDQHGRPLDIVHRDVSPQNILVGFDGVVKVIDFGIAKAADSANFTRTGVLKGKYAYMSPEQAEARRLDRRSDVFALGIVLYELVTQRRLFKRQSDMATVKAVTDCDIPPPRLANPELDAALERILLGALTREPERRTTTAGEFARQLDAWLTQGHHPGTRADLAEFVRRVYAERLDEEARIGRPVLDSGPIPPLTRPVITDADPRDVHTDGGTDPTPLLTPPPELSSPAMPARTNTETEPPGLSLAAAGNALGSLPSDAEAEATTDGRPRRSPLADGRRADLLSTAPAFFGPDGAPPNRASPPPDSASAPTPLQTPVIAPPVAPAKPPDVRFPSMPRAGTRGGRPLEDDNPTDKYSPNPRGKPDKGDKADKAPKLEKPARPFIPPPPVPSYELPRFRPGPGVVAPVVLDGELSEISRIVRRRRTARWLSTLLALAFLAAAGFGAWWLAGHPDWRPGGGGARLTVETDPPGADLLLDDVGTGLRSPATLELRAGRVHVIEARLDGHLPASATVPAFEGSAKRSLRLVARNPARPPKPERPTPTTPNLPPAGPRGTIEVETTPPGITVEVDGRVLGRSPIAATEVESGRRVLRFVDPDQFLDQRLTIDVPAGKTTRFEKSLVPRPVRFDVRPPARVFVAGRHLVDAPGDATLVPGRYDVSYVVGEEGTPGRRIHRASIDIPEGAGAFVVTTELPGP